ncbi:RNA polymerase sigma factor [Lysinibacter cavernae]|uniref:RNA polymerase sigma factor (Sigma-70 family) n=1 Tax=Lysinibacter cavernae TaxID=1640652 RepID=A0A7X5R142_9MICO|nr:sigma-70 family RNA polymerase sigma factor [Lysinibacter cavernae]NIH53666.1 RNA polymerase sigma factor (sigma-70 family) [Lysinibacter cavernae]
MENNEQVFSAGLLEDQELLRRHRDGDPAAYGLLYTKYQPLAYSTARKYTSTRDQADDLVLESFTRILETIGRGKGPTVSMGHYLISTIRNVAASNGRREHNELALDPQDVAQLYERDQFHDAGNTAGWVTEAFNALGERSQQVLWYRVIEHLPSKNIAAVLGISAATVTRTYQAAALDLRTRFVTVSLAASSDPECRPFGVLLHNVARSPKRAKTLLNDEAFRAHLESCAHCQSIVSRIGSSDRVLLSLAFLAGLGALATQALEATSVPASAANVGFAAWGVPAKIALVATPLLGAVVVGAVVLGGMLFATPRAESAQLVIGDLDPGTTKTLLRVGECALVRQPVDNTSEAWTLTSAGADCNVRVAYAPLAGSAGHTTGREGTLLDTESSSGVRTLEIARPGSYTVRLSEGSETRDLVVSVVQ